MAKLDSLLNLAARAATYPRPLRIPLLKLLLRRMHWLPYATRLQFDAVYRPHYGFCIYHAALLAKALGIPAISVLEFGVAGGNGLVNIERHVSEISKELGIRFEVYGFDMETGLPKPLDYRDMPYMWAEGFYKMDRALLQQRLRLAKLVIGDVSHTCRTFFDQYRPAPIGCVLFDLDYYSSTAAAFQIFAAGHEHRLPRVYCYFDDIASGGLRANNEHVGVLRAIEEFNEAGAERKIARVSGLATSRRIPELWNDQVFVFHDFRHPRYSEFIGNAHQEIPLE
jgi:hypothetical protein